MEKQLRSHGPVEKMPWGLDPQPRKDPLKGGLNLFTVDSDVSRSREERANSDVNHVTPEISTLSKSAIATKINPGSSSLKPADKKQCRIQLPLLKYPSTNSKTSSYLHLPPTINIPTQKTTLVVLTA